MYGCGHLPTRLEHNGKVILKPSLGQVPPMRFSVLRSPLDIFFVKGILLTTCTQIRRYLATHKNADFHSAAR